MYVSSVNLNKTCKSGSMSCIVCYYKQTTDNIIVTYDWCLSQIYIQYFYIVKNNKTKNNVIYVILGWYDEPGTRWTGTAGWRALVPATSLFTRTTHTCNIT